MWFAPSSSVVSVCVKWRWGLRYEMERSRVSLCSLAMHLPKAVLLQCRYCCLPDSTLWVSVWIDNNSCYMRWREVEPHCVDAQCICQMLCPFNADVVEFKIHRCDCLCETNTIVETWDGEKSNFTVFTCNALAICCAPSTPMLFSRRLSVVSVCAKER